jgi:hypothetical protein
MNTENPKRQPRRSAYSYTWELRQNVLHLKDQVTAIIETVKLVNNNEYQGILDKKLHEAKMKNKERWANKKPKENSKKKGKPKSPSGSDKDTSKVPGGASQDPEDMPAAKGPSARKFQF